MNIEIFEELFERLQETNSRIDKLRIVEDFIIQYPELQEDLTYILETLAGKHPIGWTFEPSSFVNDFFYFRPIRDVIMYLETQENKSTNTCENAEFSVGKELGYFIAPIVNRTLKLGIGKSLLTKTDLTPMLAKKYEGETLYNQVYVTEKLDGNRCIAYYDDKWNFTSRNGKKMNVNFDMTGLSTDFIYDGEVMSVEQTERSKQRIQNLHLNLDEMSVMGDEQLLFNKTSGIINSHNTDKNLVYNIFDVVLDWPYNERRKYLNNCKPTGKDVYIIPVIYVGNDLTIINYLLDRMCSMGSEGIMLNNEYRKYEHKRTDALLKYKQIQHCDMRVIGIFEGRGKYEDMCGGLVCYMKTDDGKEVRCEVGTGLSDAQRILWAQQNWKIVDKIVEVAYHEMTQDRNNLGTNKYSLRFPRLKKIRDDKNDTSEF